MEVRFVSTDTRGLLSLARVAPSALFAPRFARSSEFPFRLENLWHQGINIVTFRGNNRTMMMNNP